MGGEEAEEVVGERWERWEHHWVRRRGGQHCVCADVIILELSGGSGFTDFWDRRHLYKIALRWLG